ncbi:MAG: hypothetical protein HOP09_14500 [Hyphomicrobium sp.]|nr:hypothetical protein [Hyphomicrobium sp.]
MSKELETHAAWSQILKDVEAGMSVPELAAKHGITKSTARAFHRHILHPNIRSQPFSLRMPPALAEAIHISMDSLGESFSTWMIRAAEIRLDAMAADGQKPE